MAPPPPTLEDLERAGFAPGHAEEEEEEEQGEKEEMEEENVSVNPPTRNHETTASSTNVPVQVANRENDQPEPPKSNGESNTTTTAANNTIGIEPTSSSTTPNSYYGWIKLVSIVILVVLMAILGVGIAILVELHQNNDGENDVGRITSTEDEPTTSPTMSISSPPSDVENHRPSPGGTSGDDDNDSNNNNSTEIIDCQVPSFQSIANQPGARLLSGLQSCDLGTHACEAIIHLPFDFINYNSNFMVGVVDPRTTIYVTPSGMIRFYKYGYSNNLCALECAGISIFAKLGTISNYNGDIWVLVNTTTIFGKSLTVSWENVSFDSSFEETNLYNNAQLTLYENGNVQMCWGSGNIIENGSMQAAIWDNSENFGIYFPITVGYPFQQQQMNSNTNNNNGQHPNGPATNIGYSATKIANGCFRNNYYWNKLDARLHNPNTLASHPKSFSSPMRNPCPPCKMESTHRALVFSIQLGSVPSLSVATPTPGRNGTLFQIQ